MTINRSYLVGMFGLYLMICSFPSRSATVGGGHYVTKGITTAQPESAGSSSTALQTGPASPQQSTYTGFTGPITFTCTVSDDSGLLGSAALTVNVVPPDVGPWINVVLPFPSFVPPAGSVLVYMNVIDSAPIVQVTANGTFLQSLGGTAWFGAVPANPGYGAHRVAVVAVDSNGQSATDVSARYTTVRTVVVSGKALNDPILATAAPNFLFTVYGTVSTTALGTFVLDDGSGFPVTVEAPGAALQDGDYAVATGTLFTGADPVMLYSSANQIEKLN